LLELLSGEKVPGVPRLAYWLRIVTLAAVVDCVMLLFSGTSQVVLSLVLLGVGVALLIAIVVLDRAIKSRGGSINWSIRRP
jgi:hypothetical protein